MIELLASMLLITDVEQTDVGGGCFRWSHEETEESHLICASNVRALGFIVGDLGSCKMRLTVRPDGTVARARIRGTASKAMKSACRKSAFKWKFGFKGEQPEAPILVNAMIKPVPGSDGRGTPQYDTFSTQFTFDTETMDSE